jgi:hypothetical protein
MRAITTLVFLMFISGYYLHLDRLGWMNRTDNSYQKTSQQLENNLFTQMLAKLPDQNEAGFKGVLFSAASASDSYEVGKTKQRIPFVAAGTYSLLDDIGIKRQPAFYSLSDTCSREDFENVFCPVVTDLDRKKRSKLLKFQANGNRRVFETGIFPSRS